MKTKQKELFNPDNIRKYKLSWWRRVIFFFIPTHVSYDVGELGDKSVMFLWKKWRGNYYLVGEEIV